MVEQKKAPGETDANKIESKEYNEGTQISQADVIAEAKAKLIEANGLPELKEITGEYLLNFKADKMARLLEPFLPKVGIVCLAGGSDTGKSCLLRQLAIACATGDHSFLKFQLSTHHKSAIFVATEDDEHATSFLLSKQAGKYNSKELNKLRFLFDTDNLLEILEQRLTNQKADLVVIDCFADAFSGDLKDTQKIRTFLHQYQELSVRHQCLIIFLHHTAKRTENFEPSKNNLLSGQGLEAKMRMVMELRVDLMNPNTRHVCIVKGNYLPSIYKKESFVLDFDESTFTFSNTGERTPFEFLVKQNEDSGKAKYSEAKALKELGYTYDLIAEKIGYQSKGSVSKLFDKAEKQGWDKQ